eukprot:TRINITY_DN649_c0_g1_i1.p1 TRINITY_DN649_c0_g1~~TRINITY_DN649_c0_g1_i1.p1  ORF type:complete len:139 (-),score=30.30 TRINITY_DN649_c0_g1_i1:327-743(-)
MLCHICSHGVHRHANADIDGVLGIDVLVGEVRHHHQWFSSKQSLVEAVEAAMRHKQPHCRVCQNGRLWRPAEYKNARGVLLGPAFGQQRLRRLQQCDFGVNGGAARVGAVRTASPAASIQSRSRGDLLACVSGNNSAL